MAQRYAALIPNDEVAMTWITTGVPQELFRRVKEEMEGSRRATAIVGGALPA